MEAFAVGLPVITFKPIAGHGKDNAEMMARAGVNCYARDEDELHEILREVTRPGPERDVLVDTARLLFVADPADDVEELARDRAPGRPQGPGRRAACAARTSHRDDRGGHRARAVRRVDARRTGGVRHRRRRRQAAEERPRHRLRRRPPRPHRAHRRCAARRDPDPGRVGGRRRPRRDAPLGRAGDARRPGRRHRQRRLGEGLVPALEPRPQRRVEGRQADRPGGRPAGARVLPRSPPRCVRPVLLAPPEAEAGASRTTPSRPESLPTRLESGKVYVLDGRDRDPTAMEVAVADLQAQFERTGLRAAPLGELR